LKLKGGLLPFPRTGCVLHANSNPIMDFEIRRLKVPREGVKGGTTPPGRTGLHGTRETWADIQAGNARWAQSPYDAAT
jgi:hypothetical protein